MDIKKLFNEKIDSYFENEFKRSALKKLSFKKDWSYFETQDKKIFFVEKPNIGFNEESNDLLVNKIKIFLKKYPKIFFIVFRSVGLSFLGKSSKDAIDSLPKGSVIVNMGSGPTVVREDVINIDFYPFKNVDIVADISKLPFEDGVVDGVICEHVLEHVPDPSAVVAEIHRVLKPGGIVYVVIPFVMSFHSSPYDYYRWSKLGLREELKDFKEVDCGMRSGPGAAADYVLAEFFAILLSFGITSLHQVLFIFFLILFAPLCWIDYLISKFKTSENIAQHFYFIGKKK